MLVKCLQFLSHGFASKLALLLTDVLGLLLLFNLAHWFRMGEAINLKSGPIWVIVMITVVTFYIMDVYRTEAPITRARLPLQTFLAVPVAAVLTAVFVYTLGVSSFMAIFGRGIMPLSFFLFSLWAASFRWLLTAVNQRYGDKLQWLLLMSKPMAQQLEDDLSGKSAEQVLHVEISSVSDALKTLPDAKVNDAKDQHQTQYGIIVNDFDALDDKLLRRISDLRFAGVNVLSHSAFYERYWSRLPVMHLDAGWFIQASGFDRIHDRVGLRFQRLLDIFISFVGLLVLSPALLFLYGLISLSSKGGAIFSQQRVGLNGKTFTLYKFRSMVDNAEQDGPVWAQENDPRVTPLGKFLRGARLDELPQLWNILKGEMSLIGPRPERPEFVAELRTKIPHYDLRHLLVPGLTGWAQVMYRYTNSVDESVRKLEYDLYYIKNQSLQLDFAILIKTLISVFRRKGQ